MTATPLSNMESEKLPDPTGHLDDTELGKVVGKSPMRLAMERFRADKRSMVSFWVIVVFALLTIVAPIANHVGLINPYKFHQDALNPLTMPNGAFSGISWHHLLGVEPGFGEMLGLSDDWAFQAIRQVGNYGEIFERNVGARSALKLERGQNALWNAERPGLLYAPPMR